MTGPHGYKSDGVYHEPYTAFAMSAEEYRKTATRSRHLHMLDDFEERLRGPHGKYPHNTCRNFCRHMGLDASGSRDECADRVLRALGLAPLLDDEPEGLDEPTLAPEPEEPDEDAFMGVLEALEEGGYMTLKKALGKVEGVAATGSHEQLIEKARNLLGLDASEEE
jgi:hypothetical protein